MVVPFWQLVGVCGFRESRGFEGLVGVEFGELVREVWYSGVARVVLGL